MLASHTLLGASIVDEAGANSLEPIAVTFGATVISDTLSLVVFAVCVSTYASGFSMSVLGVQLFEIAIFVPLILFGLSRIGARVLTLVQADEGAYFVVMFAILAIAGVLADAVNLPGIVGAFLAGLALNAAAKYKPAKEKLELLGKSLLIPIFFIVTEHWNTNNERQADREFRVSATTKHVPEGLRELPYRCQPVLSEVSLSGT